MGASESKSASKCTILAGFLGFEGPNARLTTDSRNFKSVALGPRGQREARIAVKMLRGRPPNGGLSRDSFAALSVLSGRHYDWPRCRDKNERKPDACA